MMIINKLSGLSAGTGEDKPIIPRSGTEGLGRRFDTRDLFLAEDTFYS